MCDSESFVKLRSPNSPKGARRRVRAMFVCPSCGWKLQAVLEQELTTVRCECEAEFAVRKPVAKPAKNRYQTISRPPLRSMLQGSVRSGGSSDTDSHASIPSHSSIQSIMVSHCSSASSAVVSISAPSVHSIPDSPTNERRAAPGLLQQLATQATRVGLPESLLEEESRQTSEKGQTASASSKSRSPARNRNASASRTTSAEPSASSVSEGGLGSPLGSGAAVWLGQIFSNSSLSS